MKRILTPLWALFLYISGLAQRPPADYSCYVPHTAATQAMPVVFFFDPHGDGSLPVNRYRTLGGAYGFILVGSNLSKNGNDWPLTENIWNHLISEIRQRFRIDEHRLYVCGFSGGAKVASYIAIQHSGIRAVGAGGAGLPDGVSATDFPFSFTALAGEGDMNLTDLLQLSNELDHTRTRHRIILFDGKHEWAPPDVMDQVFSGWQLEAMRDGLIARVPAFIGQVSGASRSRVAASMHANRLIRAGEECRTASSWLEGLTDEAGWFRKTLASLESDSRYKKQVQERDALFAREESIKATYMREFQQGDNTYWQQTITGLQANARKDGPEKGMYQRLLAYLSLAFYSISNQLINAGQNEPARHFVELYKLADPINSEAWYFSAVLDVREGRMPQAVTDLEKAVSLGFSDKDRLRRQPEFQKSFSAAEFSRIEQRMSK